MNAPSAHHEAPKLRPARKARPRTSQWREAVSRTRSAWESARELRMNHVAIGTTVSTRSTSSVLAREKVFGPVLAITTFGDEREAIQIANDSQYGCRRTVDQRPRPRSPDCEAVARGNRRCQHVGCFIGQHAVQWCPPVRFRTRPFAVAPPQPQRSENNSGRLS